MHVYCHRVTFRLDTLHANKGNNKITEHCNLPNGKAKLISQQADKISQQSGNWENRNGPDLVQAFTKKW